MKGNGTSYAGERSGTDAQCKANPAHRILIVEDDTAIRETSAAMLIRFGYRVDAAEDGAAGWKALHAKHYDLLITDNNMPKICGIELVEKLRAVGMTLPVILASGAMPTQELKRHPWLKLAATLLKPFGCDELLGAVKKVLRATERARQQTKPLPICRSRSLAGGLRR
jgi:DNA-binding response OmpR family regulator